MEEKSRIKARKKKFTNGWLVLSFFLFVCVAVTSILVANRLSALALQDKEVIALVPSEEEETSTGDKNVHPMPVTEQNSTQTENLTPGFQVEDNQTVWTTHTSVEIFHVQYENEQQEIVVSGNNGDKVIAPGTENNYDFCLKNTGNTAIDYTMEVEAYITPNDIKVPVNVRMKSYEGNYLIGNDELWTDVLALNGISDHATLATNRYAQYMLEWQWPFESENDELDTLLGNQAVEEDITLTIVIKTTATENTDPNALGGIDIPDDNGFLIKTGDIVNAMPYIIGAAISAAVFILLLLLKRRKEEDTDAEGLDEKE